MARRTPSSRNVSNGRGGGALKAKMVPVVKRTSGNDNDADRQEGTKLLGELRCQEGATAQQPGRRRRAGEHRTAGKANNQEWPGSYQTAWAPIIWRAPSGMSARDD